MDSVAGNSGSNNVRHAGTFTLILRDGVWTDARLKSSTTTLRVKAFSDAYFKVREILADLKEPFSVGDRVTVMGRDVAIAISPDGKETLSARDEALLRDKW